MVTTLTGNTEAFEFFEQIAFEDHIYYRLRIVTSAEADKFSRTLIIHDNGQSVPLRASVFPNPIVGHQLQYQWYSKGSTEQIEVQVHDLRGVLIHSDLHDATSRMQHLTIELPQHLDAGMYLLTFSQGQQAYQVKFIIE